MTVGVIIQQTNFLDLTSTHKQNFQKHKYGRVYILTTPNIANQPFWRALIPISGYSLCVLVCVAISFLSNLCGTENQDPRVPKETLTEELRISWQEAAKE